VAYDHGDAPYNIVNMRETSGGGRDAVVHVPIRITTFARLHRGEYPTLTTHMLTKATA
jgi:hypothetical protein